MVQFISVQINASLLADLIAEEVAELTNLGHDESRVAIGVDGCLQVQLVITKDMANTIEDPDPLLIKTININRDER